MKIISWNVNGLRAVLAKDMQGERNTTNPNVFALIANEDPDIIALQETKCPEDLDVSKNKKLRSKTVTSTDSWKLELPIMIDWYNSPTAEVL